MLRSWVIDWSFFSCIISLCAQIVLLKLPVGAAAKNFLSLKKVMIFS